VKPRTRTFTRALLASAASAAIAGCGLSQTGGSPAVSVTVTRGFGSTRIAAASRPNPAGSETVVKLLRAWFSVTVDGRPGATRIASIDGLPAGASSLSWRYYVNGVEPAIGAELTKVHPGDRIWWDLNDGGAASAAVVGAFPEPFVHGLAGRRLPTTLDCAGDVAAACRRVEATLTAAGVPVARQLIGTGSGPDTLAVEVGTWADIHGELVAGLLEHGPSLSGVFARPVAPTGHQLQVLDSGGHVVRTLGADTGLIAAVADPDERARNRYAAPTWLITGTDAAGVSAAAAALNERRLRDHFALVIHGGTDLPLPAQ
jgi:hypothetical protein